MAKKLQLFKKIFFFWFLRYEISRQVTNVQPQWPSRIDESSFHATLTTHIRTHTVIPADTLLRLVPSDIFFLIARVCVCMRVWPIRIHFGKLIISITNSHRQLFRVIKLESTSKNQNRRRTKVPQAWVKKELENVESIKVCGGMSSTVIDDQFGELSAGTAERLLH